jgi:hypothetical protein
MNGFVENGLVSFTYMMLILQHSRAIVLPMTLSRLLKKVYSSWASLSTQSPQSI